jgi:thiol-disulfide isomerase/thioredoxin
MKYVLSILVFYWFGSLNAQQVFLHGHVSGQLEGTPVRLQVYSDPYSMLLQTLGSAKLDEQGNFSMRIDAAYARQAFLAVGLKKGMFFIEPGDHYTIQVDNDSLTVKGSIFDQKPLQMLVKSQRGSLNDDFGRFNAMVDDFLVTHLNDLYRFHRKGVLNAFENKLKSTFQNDTGLYFRQSMYYRMADTRWSARLLSNVEAYQTYFVKPKADIRNEAFARFFTDFIENYFASRIHGPLTKNSLAQVASLRSLKALDTLFASNSLLAENRKIRTLAEMVVMRKYYRDRNFSKADFDALFESLSDSSSFADIRQIAKHFLVKLHQMAPGTLAPAFQLPDVMGNEHQLKDFKGKFVLLSFFKTDCPVCLRDLDLLEKMQQNMGGNFTQLSILMGQTDNDWMEKLLSGRFSWPFLLLGNQLPLLEKYQVRSFPAYVLLAPDGTVAMAPAPMPAEGGGQQIAAFISQFVKQHRAGHAP